MLSIRYIALGVLGVILMGLLAGCEGESDADVVPQQGTMVVSAEATTANNYLQVFLVNNTGGAELRYDYTFCELIAQPCDDVFIRSYPGSVAETGIKKVVLWGTDKKGHIHKIWIGPQVLRMKWQADRGFFTDDYEYHPQIDDLRQVGWVVDHGVRAQGSAMAALNSPYLLRYFNEQYILTVHLLEKDKKQGDVWVSTLIISLHPYHSGYETDIQ